MDSSTGNLLEKAYTLFGAARKIIAICNACRTRMGRGLRVSLGSSTAHFASGGKFSTHRAQRSAHWLQHHGWQQGMTDAVRNAALQWAFSRGLRSGRVSGQFARDWCGKQKRPSP